MLIALSLAAAATTTADADERIERMAALYDTICLKAFPDDETMVAFVSQLADHELSPEDVRVTMVDDPARGWMMPDGKTTVWLEFPPYHACSVRWSMPEIGNPAPYLSLIERYMADNDGFSPLAPYEADSGPIHIRAIGLARGLPEGGTENLYVFEQHITDPQRRAAGETGFSLRFVHQYAPPEPRSAE